MFECGTKRENYNAKLKGGRLRAPTGKSRKDSQKANSEALSKILKNLSQKLTVETCNQNQNFKPRNQKKYVQVSSQQHPKYQGKLKAKDHSTTRPRKPILAGGKNTSFYEMVERVKGVEAPVIQLSFGKRKSKKNRNKAKRKSKMMAQICARERGATDGSWESQEGQISKKPDLKTLLNLVKNKEDLKFKAKNEQPRIIDQIFFKSSSENSGGSSDERQEPKFELKSLIPETKITDSDKNSLTKSLKEKIEDLDLVEELLLVENLEQNADCPTSRSSKIPKETNFAHMHPDCIEAQIKAELKELSRQPNIDFERVDREEDAILDLIKSHGVLTLTPTCQNLKPLQRPKQKRNWINHMIKQTKTLPNAKFCLKLRALRRAHEGSKYVSKSGQLSQNSGTQFKSSNSKNPQNFGFNSATSKQKIIIKKSQKQKSDFYSNCLDNFMDEVKKELDLYKEPDLLSLLAQKKISKDRLSVFRNLEKNKDVTHLSTKNAC